ncbi:lecithin retinol acyltransferase family protein [Pseudoalteromonas sp. T1lg75]|uniref:lecithin retinol acyltransferase family protein n=1 Tax=Pseudoalteromonas sp. T1lg75 TaxID=2077102 RepID=UPI0018FE152D|nr:lecithin retinol acyltransferase family protein [Pseudoalteromonas sp. T1lg75]
MLKFLPFVTPLVNMVEGVVDSCRVQVTPVEGSILYCDLVFGYAEHSGVYIGDGQIVHLNGQGKVEVVSPYEFVEGTTAINIYVSCRNKYAVGCDFTADRARQAIHDKRNYNVLLDNCHQFSAGCITGDFENSSNMLRLLKYECETYFRANIWRQWDIDLF